jgi:hypothetical protein
VAYVKPENARAPRGSWQLEDVLIDQGESPPDGQPAKFSLATGYWEETPCLAIRWNGYEGQEKTSGVGYPQAIGNATWFVLPTEFNRVALPLVPAQKRDRVLKFLSINEAGIAPEQNRISFPPRRR